MSTILVPARVHIVVWVPRDRVAYLSQLDALQLVQRSLSRISEAHQVQFQFGVRDIIVDFDAPLEEPLFCLICPRAFVSC